MEALIVGQLTRDPIALGSRGSVRRADDVTGHVPDRGRTSQRFLRSYFQVTTSMAVNAMEWRIIEHMEAEEK